MSTENLQGKSDPLRLDSQICFPLYSAANAVTRAYRPLLKEFDLTYLQYIVMMVLWERQRVNVKTLGEELHLDSGTLTPLLKRLEAKALVVRQRSESDERVREISLTDEGRALKAKMAQVPAAMACRVALSVEELMELKRLSQKLLSQLADNGPAIRPVVGDAENCLT
ncbi:DNA-binding transcriptional regulator, MarR family [Ferrimonas marina]|uniref:DNA-binding transcriptional regulator, MarR family n=1 Tax=Ferrimonas marina TaxID=299255 RepID=A0A1M5MPF5_9GAMM|nr:DNA-binding transcriptional regulator, MarR family [Ferrimonas marina]